MSEVVKIPEFPNASGVFAPTDHSPEALREWIYQTCRYLGLTPTEFAKSADLAASTINRFLRQVDEANLSARSLDALLEAARRIEADEEFSPKPYPPEPDDGRSYRPQLRDVSLLGSAASGVFHDYKGWAQHLYALRVPVFPPFERRPVAAFTVADDHAAPVFPKGSIVIVTTLFKDPLEPPKQGDYVTQFGPGTEFGHPGKMEMTIRRVVFSPSDEMWLVAINQNMGIKDIYIGPGEAWRTKTFRPHSLVIESLAFHNVRAN